MLYVLCIFIPIFFFLRSTILIISCNNVDFFLTFLSEIKYHHHLVQCCVMAGTTAHHMNQAGNNSQFSFAEYRSPLYFYDAAAEFFFKIYLNRCRQTWVFISWFHTSKVCTDQVVSNKAAFTRLISEYLIKGECHQCIYTYLCNIICAYYFYCCIVGFPFYSVAVLKKRINPIYVNTSILLISRKLPVFH